MRTTSKRVAFAGLIVAVTLVSNVTGQIVPPGGSGPAPPVPPVIRLPLTSIKPDAAIDVGGDRRLSATADGVWVSNRAAGTIARIDPKTNALGSHVPAGPAGHGPCHPAVAAFKSLWVALCGAATLARHDSSAEKPPVLVPVGAGKAGPIATGTGSIWMITDTGGILARIDPDTNAVVAEITIPPGAEAMAFGNDAFWVTSATKDVVTRINGHTNVVIETINVGKGPTSVAAGEGSIWTLNSGDGTVSRIDPATNKVAETIKSGVTGPGGTIAVGEGSVWLSAPGAPLSRIDPVTNQLRQQFSGVGGGALAIGLKAIWLAATPTAVWRIDPRRVEATRK